MSFTGSYTEAEPEQVTVCEILFNVNLPFLVIWCAVKPGVYLGEVEGASLVV